MANFVVKDADGNVIQGAVISRIPSAEVQARKDARKSVGLSDRGRIPSTVVALANGDLNGAVLAEDLGILSNALSNIHGALTETEAKAIQGVIDSKRDSLSIFAAMVEQEVSLADLTAGDAADTPSE